MLHGSGGRALTSATRWGYNDIAATNNIIMIYPDTKAWDSVGKIDPEFYKTNEGMV